MGVGYGSLGYGSVGIWGIGILGVGIWGVGIWGWDMGALGFWGLWDIESFGIWGYWSMGLWDIENFGILEALGHLKASGYWGFGKFLKSLVVEALILLAWLGIASTSYD